ncbi:MAG TPA: fructosamine kinase family protein [Propionibacteriaceae bacterium]|nr:fructosamine kinase family protein [Propionibacteriaceae bacterium]
MAAHVLIDAWLLAEIERAVTGHLGRLWALTGWDDLSARASHPAALLHGPGLSVFAKLLTTPEQAQRELAGLDLLSRRSGVRVPLPVGSGLITVGGQVLLLSEAVRERAPAERRAEDWQAIGHALATVHAITADAFGLDRDGYFGPLHQDNRQVLSNTWAEFYGQRRLLPWLLSAYDAGCLSGRQVRQVERVVARLPELGGQEPRPTLVHGDAQHHNFVSTSAGAVVIDASPYYGHPEVDLALVDYFSPVAPELFAGYADVHAIDPGFVERRELWRMFAYLGVLAVDGSGEWGRTFVRRLDTALARYA